MDPNYQKTLLKRVYRELKKWMLNGSNLSKLDDKVNTKLDEIGKLHNMYIEL